MSKSKAIRLCSIDGCDEIHRSNGYCLNHNIRFKKFGDPLATPFPYVRPPKPICGEDGCDELSDVAGFCAYHYGHRRYVALRDGPPLDPNRVKRWSSRTSKTFAERLALLEQKINRNGPYPRWRLDLGRCHVWTGGGTGGYAMARANGGTFMVHRLMWEHHIGPISAGMTVDHWCRNRACQNVWEHMELVTLEENSSRRHLCDRCLFFAECPDCHADLSGCGLVPPPSPQLIRPELVGLPLDQRLVLETVEGPYSELVGSTCLDWLGRRNAKGYGYVQNPATRKGQLMHRFAYELVHGPLPDGWVTDHRCLRKACVRVDHLEAVTHAENSRRAHSAESSCARCILLRECPSCHLDIAGVTSADRWRTAA